MQEKEIYDSLKDGEVTVTRAQDEDVLAVAATILSLYHDAFEELAK